MKDPASYGAMLVSIVGGSDKTTVSAGTSHQEYHPVYASVGNISNTACQSHGNGILPVTFLPILKSLPFFEFEFDIQLIISPKASRLQCKTDSFKIFTQQLYHACLKLVFGPLKPYMQKPKVVICPDGHFRHAIFSIGPYLADYPEQVWLTGIVSNWCPKYVYN